MPTLRLARVVALAAVLSACGDRSTTTTSAPVTPAPVAPAAEGAGAPGASGVPAPAGAAVVDAAAPPATAAPQVAVPAGSAAPPGSAGQAGSDAAAAAAPAPPAAPAGPAPVVTVLREAVAVEPGGATVALAAGAEAVIEPGARFQVVLAIVSEDARLLLLDASDAVVAGEGAHELGQATRLTFAPSAPLVPGRRYTLRVDGAATRELHGASGTAFAPASLKVLVAGTPPAPEPKPKPATRRKRRSR